MATTIGSSVTPLKRQRSVKLHIDENARKSSIKITVSSDALAETILKNNVTSSASVVDTEEVPENDASNQHQSALIQIVGNCCSNSVDGIHGSLSTGSLCNCSNGDEKRTRIALDEYTVLEFPSCIDFGIKDFLCCKDEIELDLSSDTDASYLDATPPHRFSDSELDNQIEAMSITLDTQLNPYPNSGFLLKNNMGGDDDDDEEETTEESFIMDEEEVSSSASNSAATICGTSDTAGVTDLELDDHISVSSSEMVFSCSTTANDSRILPQNENNTESCEAAKNREKTRFNECDQDFSEKENKGSKASVNDMKDSICDVTMKPQEAFNMGEARKESLDGLDCEELKDSVTTEPGMFVNVDDPSKKSGGVILQMETPKSSQQHPISRKILQHPSKHFRRQISLPASIFMSYLLEQNNKGNYAKPSTATEMNHQNEERNIQQHHNCDVVVKNKLNRSNSCSKKTIKPCSRSKIQPYYQSAKVIHGSPQDYGYDDIHFSKADKAFKLSDYASSGSSCADDSKDDNSLLSDCGREQSSWAWESKSDTCNEQSDTHNDAEMDEQQAFTSDVEKRSLILRHVRRLIRQDTSGNFAPPDFSI